jgi:hypothetical protein
MIKTPEEAALRARFEAAELLRNRRFARLQAEVARRSTSATADRQQAEVDAYRNKRIEELRDPNPQNDHRGILPELVDLIGGRTRAEVDQSLTTMVEKTRSVVESVWEAQ